jgi:hypothetical protein
MHVNCNTPPNKDPPEGKTMAVIAVIDECLTAACKAFSLANAKGKGINELVVRSLDD